MTTSSGNISSQPRSWYIDALGSLLKGVGLGDNILLTNIGMASGTEAIVDARLVSRFNIK